MKLDEDTSTIYRQAEAKIEQLMLLGNWDKALSKLLDLQKLLAFERGDNDQHHREIELNIARCQREIGDLEIAKNIHLELLRSRHPRERFVRKWATLKIPVDQNTKKKSQGISSSRKNLGKAQS